MKRCTAKPRHPVTGARFTLSARTPAELGAYMHRLETLRTELRLGMKSPAQVEHELRHMRHGPVTLERAFRGYVERPELRPETRRGMLSWWRELAPSIAKLALSELDAPRVRAWLERLASRGMAASSVNAAWRKLSALGHYATSRGWIGAAPWGSFKPPKMGGPGRAPRDMTSSIDELVAILQAARDLARERREAGELGTDALPCKVFLAILLGLRQGELAGLRWTDVVWGPPVVVTIARQWNGQPLKRGTRVAKLEGVDALQSVLCIQRLDLLGRGLFDPKGPVLPAPSSERGRPRAYARGEVLTSRDVRAVIDRASIRPSAGDAGPAGAWSAHGLRGSFVTLEALASGGDLRRVQRRSRHASLASLVKYLRAVSQSAPASPLLMLPSLDGGDAGALLPPHGET